MKRTERNLMNGIIRRVEEADRGEYAFEVRTEKEFSEFSAYYSLLKNGQTAEEVAVRYSPREKCLEMCLVAGSEKRIADFLQATAGIQPTKVNRVPIGIPNHVETSINCYQKDSSQEQESSKEQEY